MKLQRYEAEPHEHPHEYFDGEYVKYSDVADYVKAVREECAPVAWMWKTDIDGVFSFSTNKESVKKFVENATPLYTTPQDQSKKIADLEARLKVAEDALEFYADRKNWHKDSQQYGSFEVSDYNIIYNDFYEQNQQTRYAGNVAVKALNKIRGNVCQY
jgi:hypothetical protein